ncbi:TM2 domain-containing protein, partial [Spirulina sp. 06S082]|uniref:TM2 domain-containing protein n=1 Tax=Spirulina sp. 06S082 TaxID=3110248 RepID=UPI002B1FF103
MFNTLWQKPRNQKIAVILALAGTIAPIVGLHKFYLRQPLWGIFYLILFATPIPHIASAIEAIWYLFLEQEEFDRRFNDGIMAIASQAPSSNDSLEPQKVKAMSEALRQLEGL